MKRLFPSFIGVTILFVTAGCDVISAVGSGVDQTCIVGKISATDAAALNASHPKWSDPPAKEGDRVLNGDCSELLRSATGRNTD